MNRESKNNYYMTEEEVSERLKPLKETALSFKKKIRKPLKPFH